MTESTQTAEAADSAACPAAWAAISEAACGRTSATILINPQVRECHKLSTKTEPKTSAEGCDTAHKMKMAVILNPAHSLPKICKCRMICQDPMICHSPKTEKSQQTLMTMKKHGFIYPAETSLSSTVRE